MNSSRRKIAAILEALGVPPSARRPAAPAATPACEPLDGRQLLTGGLGMAGMGLGMGAGIADVSGQWSGGASMAPPATATDAARVQLRSDIAQYQDDLQAIQDKSQVTPAMEYTVTAATKAIKAAETTSPNPAATAILKADTRAAQANPGGPTDYQAALVAIAQDAVDASEGVGAGLIGQLDADRAAIMTASNKTAADEATLAADQAAIAADQAKLPTSTTPTTAPATAAAATAPAAGPSAGMAGTPDLAGHFGDRGGLDADGTGFLDPASLKMGGMGTAWMGGAGMTATGGGTASTALPGLTGVPATPSNTTAPVADQVAFRLAVEKLQIDTQAVHDKSQVTPMMEAAARQDLETIRGAATTDPSPTAVATLQADLKAAQSAAGAPTAAQTAQVQADQDSVYLSEGVNAALVGKLDADKAAIKAASNETAADESDLAADVAAVKADQAKLAASATPTSTAAPATAPGSTTTPTATTSADPAGPMMTQGPGFRGIGGDHADIGLGGDHADFGRGGFDPRS